MVGHTTKLFLPCLSLYHLKLPNFSFENFISNSFLRKTELNLSNRFQIESLEMTWYKLKLRKSLFSITLWLNMRLILFSVHVKCVKSWDLLSVRILSNHILSVSFRTFQEREVIPFSFFFPRGRGPSNLESNWVNRRLLSSFSISGVHCFIGPLWYHSQQRPQNWITFNLK